MAKPNETTCRRCTRCPDLSHHWMERFDDGQWEHSPEPRPVWGCKHCDFVMPYLGGDQPEDDYIALLLELRVLQTLRSKVRRLEWSHRLARKEAIAMRRRAREYFGTRLLGYVRGRGDEFRAQRAARRFHADELRAIYRVLAAAGEGSWAEACGGAMGLATAALDHMEEPHSQWDADCIGYHGAVLTGKHKHWCCDWDDLPIDETCGEFHLLQVIPANTDVACAGCGFKGGE